MMRSIVVLVLWLTFASSAPALAEETYDLIFKTGTLSDLPRESSIVYDQNVKLRDDADASALKIGKVKLTFQPEDMARLRFFQKEKHRTVGEFPATVGNPIIMYFVETVVRDVARYAGGSPFYIRNRVKASLLHKVPIDLKTVNFQGAEINVKQLTLRPFQNDKNRDRMRGFEDLALTITMSEAVPGWYYSLTATTKAPVGGAPVYINTLTLTPEG